VPPTHEEAVRGGGCNGHLEREMRGDLVEASRGGGEALEGGATMAVLR